MGKRTLCSLPIFRQEDLASDLRTMAPYMCDGSCDQIRAERERKQLEWEAMPQAEKDARRERVAAKLKEVQECILRSIGR